MCMICGREEAWRVQVLRLLALIEHPGALPGDATLRLGREIMALVRPVSGMRMCESVPAPQPPTAPPQQQETRYAG